MNYYLLVIFFWQLIVSYAFGDTASDREQWYAERRAWVAEAKIQPSTASFTNLSRILLGIGSGLERATPESLQLYRDAQKLIMSVPGYADYFRDQIMNTRSAAMADLDDQVQFSMSYAKFMNERSSGFKILQQLPSVETVRVLGEFLDEQEVASVTIDRGSLDSPLSILAVRSLIQLPFDPKPVATDFAYQAERDLSAWQNWFERIKAGNETFRFEGDPTEYDLAGPASNEKLKRIAKSRERDEERTSGLVRKDTVVEGSAEETGSISGKSGAAAMVLIGLVGILLYVLVKRKAVSG